MPVSLCNATCNFRTGSAPKPGLLCPLVVNRGATLQEPSRSNFPEEEGKLEAAEQMSRKTSSSAGHHLPSDQLNAGITATTAERHLKHINPHVDKYADNYTRRRQERTNTCLHTRLHNMQWRKMRGNGYRRVRERESEQEGERGNKRQGERK